MSLKLLCWNIDGLDHRDTIERAEAVCDIIVSNGPHVVFLQEVVPSTWKIILVRLGGQYDCYCKEATDRYYPVILVLKTPDITTVGALKCTPFPTSTMGRHLLELDITYRGVAVHLMASHLESQKDHATERKKQLEAVFGVLNSLQASRTCIFGGDLNVRDEEVAAVGLPANTVDVWQACGGKVADKYTWDVSCNDNLEWPYPNKPKLRFDRTFLGQAKAALRPTSFSLVGKERLPSCKRFPSDHWGLLMEFSLC